MRAVLLLALLVAPACGAAFTFRDGSIGECVTPQGVAHEREHAADDPSAPHGFIGFTHHAPGTGWTIEWNLLLSRARPTWSTTLSSSTSAPMRAPARSTSWRRTASASSTCAAAGRAGRVVETKLAAYHRRQGYLGEPYGIARDYWARTVACADRRLERRLGLLQRS